MIVPDVNLLLYAYDASNPLHSEAVHSSDADFSRFREVSWFNPLTGERNKPLSEKRRPR
jgi:hypothetical protein